MAVRFDNSGELYTRNTGLGTISEISVACWLKISSLHSFYSTVWEFGVSGGALTLRTDTNGTIMGVATGLASSAQKASRNLSVGTWYYFGVSVSGVTEQGLMVSRADSDGSFTANTWSGPNVTSLATMRIGQGVSASTWWFNGCVAALKFWNGAYLSQSELEAEAAQFDPVRTSNLFAYYRFATASTTDNSGNGQTLSGGSGTTSEADPSLATAISLADAASAAETLSVAATTPLTETASATDSLTAIRLITLNDTASAAEALTVAATVPLTDTGTAADSVFNGQPIILTDVGAAAETLTVGATAGITETAGAAEALSVTAATPLTETASATEALTVSEVFFPVLEEAASAVDSLTVVELKDRHAAALPLRRTWSSTPPTT